MQITLTNSFVRLIIKFVSKTKNFLGQQRNFVSSTTTMRLATLLKILLILIDFNKQVVI